ncbi:hypothetical protein ACFYUD_26585 [Nocardia tengchongensis]|uniref:hypothetical protein n=1 Tax=Nocardia tengchongensis TaxID=2055889 RepID=UPI003696AFF3
MTNATALPTAALGNTRVGAQGYGVMGISEFYGPTDAVEARATLERALELSAAELTTLDAIAGRVAGNRYADMNFTSAGRE